MHLSARRFIAIFRDKYILKLFDDGIDSVEKELRMMLLAGDCSVIPLGRVFKEGKLYGIIMPYETPVVPPSPDPSYTPLVSSEFSRGDRLRIINQLRVLLSRLHAKGIIHCDIKPSNLLLCSDGELRFSDFGEAAMEGEGDIPCAMTIQYSSPFICRTIPLVPLTKAEDLYAAGISMWEIYTGRVPFDDVDEDTIEDVIKSGVRPDITLIDDAMVAKFVVSYLDSGDRSIQQSVSADKGDLYIY
jgi:serine/threonine protein kinase